MAPNALSIAAIESVRRRPEGALALASALLLENVEERTNWKVSGAQDPELGT